MTFHQKYMRYKIFKLLYIYTIHFLVVIFLNKLTTILTVLACKIKLCYEFQRSILTTTSHA